MTHTGKAAEYLRTENASNPCPFSTPEQIEGLTLRSSPYWHALFEYHHIGIHKPDETMCNWTARVRTDDGLYKQRCVGQALDKGKGSIPFKVAVERAFEWFETGSVKDHIREPRKRGRVTEVNFCPIGDVYTVGHALRDYTEWTRLARSPGGHYNNLVLINFHLVPRFANLPLEEFTAIHLRELAQQVLETQPKHGFSKYPKRIGIETLTSDQLRRRKRTFNSLVTILKMAFRHAWDNGQIQTERPWRCLKRIYVNHQPRTIFLDRDECRRLLDQCSPALKDLVLAALYTGCRVGELGNLIVDDVGKQGFGIRVGAFKRSPARFVFGPDEGMAFFLSKCEGKGGQDYVLLSEMGKPWRKQHMRLFKRAVSQAGLPKTLAFHGLRHTYASDLIRSGVPLDVVARQLGHANSMTVSNTYGHLAEHFRESQIRSKFPALSEEQLREMEKRREQLDRLWSAAQTDDWRQYAATQPNGTYPRKSFANPVRGVVEIFESAERLARMH